MASPLPTEQPKDHDVLVKPAVEGTLNVLKAAAAEPMVKRVVVCSSVAAVSGQCRVSFGSFFFASAASIQIDCKFRNGLYVRA